MCFYSALALSLSCSKMSPISALHISSVRGNVSAKLVRDVFSRCDIAIVGSVTFKPIFRNGIKTDFKRVIVQIKRWHETEAAYRFIKMLQYKYLTNGAKVYLSEKQYWNVQIFRQPEPKIVDDVSSVTELSCFQREDDDDTASIDSDFVKLLDEEEYMSEVFCEACGKTTTWSDVIETKECSIRICYKCFHKEDDLVYGMECPCLGCLRVQKRFCIFKLNNKSSSDKTVKTVDLCVPVSA